jgi:hypothetical protein
VARLEAVVAAHAAKGGMALIATHVALGLAAGPPLEMKPAPDGAATAAADPFLDGAFRVSGSGVRAARRPCSRGTCGSRCARAAARGSASRSSSSWCSWCRSASGPRASGWHCVAPGTLWIAALLACLLSLDRLFQADAEDGTLDILALSPLPLEAVVALKALAHWLTTGLPLVVIAPLLGVTLSLPGEAYAWLVASLAVGTPGLSFLGAIGAAVTVGVRRGGLLWAVRRAR